MIRKLRPQLVLPCFAALVLASCAQLSGSTGSNPSPELASATTAAEDGAQSESPVASFGGNAEEPPPPAPKMELFRGTGLFVNPTAGTRASATVSADGEVTLNFVEADLRDVLKAILTNVIGANYMVDPSLQGRVTLQTSKPLPKESVLFALEAVLKLNGAAVIFSDGVYNVVPLSDAERRAGAFRGMKAAITGVPGFGVQIVPLKYIASDEMEEILEPVTPSGSVIRIDAARNLLLIAGTGQEISAMLDIVNVFDVDWLEGMSFGLFRLENVDASTLLNELEVIFDSADSPVAGLVQFIPIDRMNALLALTSQPEYLDKVKLWVTRLDRRTQGPERRIYYYRVQNANAADLAGSLNNLLTGGRAGDVPIPPALPLAGQGENAGEISETPNAPKQSTLVETGGARIVTDDKSNALIILATAREYEVIQEAVKQMDVAVDQVLIEMTIAEVTLTDQLNYGVEWFFENTNSTFTLSGTNSGAISAQFPGFSYAYLFADTQIVLNALASLTDVKVVSSPKIMVLDNQTATLQVGDQVPVATQSAVSISDPNSPLVNTVQFRDTGIILEVTPRINRSGTVVLEVSQEVSDVAATTTSGIDSPTIQQRKIQTTVSVQHGETVALGGLIRENETESDSGVPFLKDIPLLGAAFSSASTSQRRTELLIFLRPRIIHNMQEAREMTADLRDKLDELKSLNLDAKLR